MNEQDFRAKKAHEFLEKHKDADLLVCDVETKEPVEAIYYNKLTEAYHRRELAGFFRRVREEDRCRAVRVYGLSACETGDGREEKCEK